MNDLDSKRFACGGGEVAQVQGDNHLGVVGSQGGRKHVAVGGRIGHPWLERRDRRGWNLGVRKGVPHGVDQLDGLHGRRAAVLEEVTSDLIEDPLTPADLVEVLLGAAQQRVPQRQRVQDTGIEHGSGRHTPTIGGSADATNQR